MKIIFYVLIGGMALAFIGIGTYSFIDNFSLHFSGKSTIGKIVGYNSSTASSNPFTESGKSDFYANGTYSSDLFYPVVMFKSESGKTIYFVSNGGSDSPDYDNGEEVTVYYNPEKPGNATINNEGWLLPAIFIPVGILLLFAVWKMRTLF